MQQTDNRVGENYVWTGEELLGTVIRLASSRAPHEAFPFHFHGAPFHLMGCRDTHVATLHIYTVSTSPETHEALEVLVDQLRDRDVDVHRWDTTEYGERRHIRFAPPA